MFSFTDTEDLIQTLKCWLVSENRCSKTPQTTPKVSLAFHAVWRGAQRPADSGCDGDPGASEAFSLGKQAKLMAGTVKHAKCVFLSL